MSARAATLVMALAVALAACSSSPPAASVSAPAGPDALYAPARVAPGVLEYAPDRSTFAPVLTERAAYPTQAEANAAYLNVQKDLGANEYSVPTERIIKLVLASDCSAYDCEYVALAQDLGVPLVTADKQVLRAFPKTAVSLEKFVK